LCLSNGATPAGQTFFKKWTETLSWRNLKHLWHSLSPSSQKFVYFSLQYFAQLKILLPKQAKLFPGKSKVIWFLLSLGGSFKCPSVLWSRNREVKQLKCMWHNFSVRLNKVKTFFFNRILWINTSKNEQSFKQLPIESKLRWPMEQHALKQCKQLF
jgi:hypothetical protein